MVADLFKIISVHASAKLDNKIEFVVCEKRNRRRLGDLDHVKVDGKVFMHVI